MPSTQPIAACKMTNRRKLPVTREGFTHSVKIGDTKVYIRTGEYQDGNIGELFISIDKQGTTLRVYDVVAILISLCLQYGVPLQTIIDLLKGQTMQPNGVTSNHNEIPIAKSITDYIARWLELKYLKGESGE